jgi:hypothetical protein
VVIVKDQQHVIALGGRSCQVIDEDADQPVERTWGGRTEQRADALGDAGPEVVHGGDDVSPEARRVVVLHIQRHPGRRAVAPSAPIGQQSRLPESRRGAHQDEWPRQSLVEILHQSRTGNEARLARGNV